VLFLNYSNFLSDWVSLYPFGQGNHSLGTVILTVTRQVWVTQNAKAPQATHRGEDYRTQDKTPISGKILAIVRPPVPSPSASPREDEQSVQIHCSESLSEFQRLRQVNNHTLCQEFPNQAQNLTLASLPIAKDISAVAESSAGVSNPGFEEITTAEQAKIKSEARVLSKVADPVPATESHAWLTKLLSRHRPRQFFVPEPLFLIRNQ